MEEKKSIKDMTVRDVLMTDLYRDYVRNVMEGEVAQQEKSAAAARAQHTRIGRTPLDNLRAKDVWDADKMVNCYGSILDKTLIGFSATERAYIEMVCIEAFRRCVRKMQELEGIDINATKR